MRRFGRVPPQHVRLHPEVAETLAAGGPVVALESAVITHGLPQPTNFEVAHEMAAAVRDEGSVPAIVAIVRGQVRIGLDANELAELAMDDRARKCSRRDVAVAVGRGESGGTTVAATAWAARLAGIGVFCTGGIGGVHRGDPADVSADLTVLARSPITVVCSGPKTLLDLGATAQALETCGVPVLGYRTDRMPAFLVADSGLPITARVDTPHEVARIAAARDTLGEDHAILVTVPIPSRHALAADQVERAIDRATAEAAAAGARGSDVTPFILGQLAERSGGRTIEANRALLVNNARVAARIARALLDWGTQW